MPTGRPRSSPDGSPRPPPSGIPAADGSRPGLSALGGCVPRLGKAARRVAERSVPAPAVGVDHPDALADEVQCRVPPEAAAQLDVARPRRPSSRAGAPQTPDTKTPARDLVPAGATRLPTAPDYLPGRAGRLAGELEPPRASEPRGPHMGRGPAGSRPAGPTQANPQDRRADAGRTIRLRRSRPGENLIRLDRRDRGAARRRTIERAVCRAPRPHRPT